MCYLMHHLIHWVQDLFIKFGPMLFINLNKINNPNAEHAYYIRIGFCTAPLSGSSVRA